MLSTPQLVIDTDNLMIVENMKTSERLPGWLT